MGAAANFVRVTRRKRDAFRLPAWCLLLAVTAAMLASGVARAEPGSCNGDISPKQQNQGGPKSDTSGQQDLKIDKPCWIDSAGTYVFGNINIIGPKGSL